jgi:type I restriction-modification system DNA methylase subunit
MNSTKKSKKMKLKIKSKRLDFKDIAPIIWNMQCELRNKEGITGINAMHHINLILLIRTLNKDNCSKLGFPEDLSFENIKNLNQKDLFEKIYNKSNISQCLLRYIRKDDRFGFNKDIPFEIKNESTLHYLIIKVQEIDTKYFFEKTDLIGDIYESFISREGKTMKDLGQYFTDRQLIDYLVKLCDPKVIGGKIETIYDGASGTGGFLTQAINYLNLKNKKINWGINRHNIYGSDINRNTFALLKLNMYFTTGQIIDNLVMKDTLVNDSLKVDGYDNILMNPPFGIKGLKYKNMNNKLKSLGINGTKGEILFLQNCMANLASEGRCVIIVPEGVLFNSTKMYKETREYLMDNFELKKVIKVGEGEFFKNTGVKTAVLFFKNTGESTKQVEFVKVNKVENKIEEVPLMNVSIENIKENKYSLNINMYKEVILNTLDNIPVKKIKEVCEYKRGKQINVKGKNNCGEYPVISGGRKPVSYIDEYNRNENTILVSGSGNAGYISRYPVKVWASDCWSIHSLDKELLSEQFLYYYLKSQQDLIISYGKGAIIKHLGFNDISMIPIPLPPVDIQKRIIEQLDNIYENEIENSKKTIEGLKISIESIMKNTLMRKDLENYKMNTIMTIKRGNLVSKSNNEDENIYPYYAGSKISGFAPSYEFENESIMMNYRLSLGAKTPCVYIKEGRYNCSRFSWVLKNKSDINFKYLYYYLNSNVNYDDLLVGSTILEINSTTLKAYKVYLPPLEIQEKIVEECNSKEKIINLLKENITQAEKQVSEIMNSLYK